MTHKSLWLTFAFIIVGLSGLAGLAQGPLAVQPGAPAAPPRPQYSPEEEADARAELGERFCDLSLSLARGARYSRQTIVQSAALLEAATRMNPHEPRFPRLLADARLQAGDTKGAIDAWIAYRKLVPDDHVAQVELIDLYLSTLQSNDQKLKYLTDLLGKGSLDNTVKAHVAASAVPLLEERSHGEALAMLAQARQFYPLPEVTLLEWKMLPPDAPLVKRFSTLLNVVRANPAQADAIARVADMLSAAGLSEPALTWYGTLMDVHAAQGTGPSIDSFVNYLGERYRAGETTVASDRLDELLQRDPLEPDFWFLRLTIQRADESAQMLKQAEQALLTQLNSICDRIVSQPSPGATTEPADTQPAATQPSAATQSSAATQPSATAPAMSATTRALPKPASAPVTATQPTTGQATIDPSAIRLAEATARAKLLDDPNFRGALVRALGDLAWFEIYFSHRPEAAVPWMNALKELVPAENTVMRRLGAWSDFTAGNVAAARPVFTELQDTDPLSALGLFRLEDDQKHGDAADAVGRKILSEPHTGVLGAILWQATKGRGLKPTSQPTDIAPLQAELDKFPKDWLEVVHAPSRFYSVRVDPIKVAHRLGEPLLAQLTIQNESKVDVTIGRLGLIRPLVVFDAQIRGQNAQTFPAITLERIMGRLVLLPNQSITQVVRIDQAELSDALRTKPEVTVRVLADVVTNPTQSENAGVRASAGGFARNFSKMFTRSASSLSLDPSRRRLFADLKNAAPGDKMLDIDLLASYVRQYSQLGATASDKAFANQYVDMIDKSRADTAPGIKIWSSYVESILLDGPEEEKIVNDMIQSNAWESRLLALNAARYLPFESQKPLAVKLAADDKDTLVKTYAAAMVQLLQFPTTRPARIRPGDTQPAATRPATEPATSQPSLEINPEAVR